MAAYISFQPSDFFNPKIYTGDNTSSQAQTGVGFQPDFSWIKCRSASQAPALTDSVRGATKYLRSDNNAAEITEADSLKSFDSDGFTVGNAAVTGASDTYVSWNWKGGTTSGIDTTGATITPAGYSFNATSGFSVIKWAGTSVAGTLPHGLGIAPKWIIVKRLEGSNWLCGHEAFGWTKNMVFNEAEGLSTNAHWNDTSPTATLFSVGTDTLVNASGSNYIAYVFADVIGYSKMGSYIATNASDGPFIYTGFKPSFIMVKSTVTGSYRSWCMFDTVRQPYNLNAGKTLYVNRNYAEGKRGEGSSSTTLPAMDILSNGFKLRTNTDETNDGADEYVYMAFAEFPIVSSNNIPVLAN